MPVYSTEEIDFSPLNLEKIIEPLSFRVSFDPDSTDDSDTGFKIIGEQEVFERNSPIKVDLFIFYIS